MQSLCRFQAFPVRYGQEKCGSSIDLTSTNRKFTF